MRNKACLLAITALALSTSATATDAPMFRGDAQHSGVYEDRGATHLAGIGWSFHSQGEFIASPAISGAVIYEGSTDGFLYALDRKTGALKWKFETKGRVVSSPAVANGIVYFGSYDGKFYAVDAATGALKWTFVTQGEKRFSAQHLHGSEPAAETMPDPWDCFLSSPVVSAGRVYFGSGDGHVYALNAVTGALDWAFKTGDVVHASPAIANGTLFIGSWDANFYALDATTGKERWRFKTGDDPAIHNQTGIQSSAAIMDGLVYFGSRDSHVYALDARSGAKKWAFATDGAWVIASPAVRDGKVYFATSDSGLLYELDGKTGKPNFSVSFQKWPALGSPALSGSMLYTGLLSGDLKAVSLKERKILWNFATDASKKNAPALTNPDGTSNFYAAFPTSFYDDAVAGYVRLKTMGTFLSSPVIADDDLYIGSTDGNLYALNLK